MPTYQEDTLPYAIYVGSEDVCEPECIGLLADHAGAVAAYAALLDQHAETRWLTLEKRGKRIRHEPCTGKWHREFARRTGIVK